MPQDGSDCGEHPSQNNEIEFKKSQHDGQQEANTKSGSQQGDDEKNSRGETKWPTNAITVRQVNDEGMSLDQKTCTRLKSVFGLTGRQKVNINLPNFNTLKKAQKEALFVSCI